VRAKELIKLAAHKIVAFIREDYVFALIIAIGIGFMWVNDKMFFGYSDRLSMLVYPLALFFIGLVILIARLLIKIIKVLFKKPPQ
jgi:hypothetical protein